MISMVGKAIRRWWALFALPTLAAFVIGFLLKGGYGSVDTGAMMACLVLAIDPIIVSPMKARREQVERKQP